MRGFNHRKAVQALNIFAQKEGGSINKMKAIKLIWLSDRLHLRKYGRTITGDTYFALKLGPVPSNTRDILEISPFSSEEELSYSDDFISITDKYNYKAKIVANTKVFSQSDKDAFEEIYKVYGHLNHFELSELSHLFPEWKRWETALQKSPPTRFLMDFNDFFHNTEKENEVFNEEEEDLALTKILYQRTENQ